MATKQYVVTLTPGSDAQRTASELRNRGLTVDNVMDEIGIISGAADDAAIASLRQAAGVLDVKESGEVQLPPPDSDVQ